MKKFFSIFLISALGFWFAPMARAQVTPRNTLVLTLTGGNTVAISTTGIITSQAFTIKPGSGFAIVPNFVLNGADTANITFNFVVSLDGTTWTTVTPFTYAVASNGTTPVIGFQNFAADVNGGANNILYCRLASIANASATRIVTINSITVTRNN